MVKIFLNNYLFDFHLYDAFDKYVIDDGLDLDGDLQMDMVYSTDNNGAVVLDANGQARVFYGIMMYVDDDLTDAVSLALFPSRRYCSGIREPGYIQRSNSLEDAAPFPITTKH